jgi:hypothetical protein
MKSSARWTGWRRGNRDGFVLPAGLFALIIVTVLVLAAVQLGDNERRATRALRASGVAIYTAESGLAATTGTWPAGVGALNPGDSLNLGWTTLSDGGSYRAVIHRVDNVGAGTTKVYAIMVEARGAGALGGRASLTRMVTTVTTPGNGVVALGTMGIGGSGGFADSYNSNNGPYDPATRGNNVTLISNGNFTLNSADTVFGNLVTGGTWSHTGTITGTVAENVTPLPAPVASYPIDACPATFSPASDATGIWHQNDGVGGFVAGSGDLAYFYSPPPSGRANYYYDMLKATGGGSVQIVYTTTPKQKLTIFIRDKLVVGGGGLFNPTGTPGLLDVRGCGTGSNHGFSLTGGSGAYFTVYAPGFDVVVGGGGDLWGAIVGLNVSGTGGSHLHYDEALGPGVGAALSMLTGSWAELQPF